MMEHPVKELEQDDLTSALRGARNGLRVARQMRESLERQITSRLIEINDLKRWAYERGLDPSQETTSYE